MKIRQQIKLIGFDLDGTLLNEQKIVTERTRKALAEIVQKGIYIVPTTGRPITGIPDEVLKLPGVRYALTANGARIEDVKARTILYEKRMKQECAKQVLAVFAQFDAMLEVYFDGTGYAEQEKLSRIHDYDKRPNMAQYIVDTRIPVPDVWEKLREMNCDVDKVQAFFRNTEDRDQAWKMLESVPGIAYTGAGDLNIEAAADNVNKGTGLSMLCKILGILQEEVMAFGDGRNDKEMLEYAGIGVAMGNSLDEVKEAADLITETNDNDGVARVLEQLI